MLSELETLQFRSEEFEDAIDLDIITALAVDIYLVLLLGNRRRIPSVLLTEVFILVFSLIIIMPLTLMMLRGSNLPKSDASSIAILAIIFSASIFCLVLANLYLWKQAKQVKTLAKLINEIENYNSLVRGITIIEKIESVRKDKKMGDRLSQRQEFFEALQITKDGLIKALELEKTIRKHNNFVADRHELLAQLENNFLNLLSFETNSYANEYGQLLDRTLAIGMTVHKEVRRLRNQG
ncbi:MAG: hypothetical protein QNJ54_27010 [Prochloraceae cyanobacterium]|nr:hypothetical protein [Prochloraceae cyanobacterium]